MKFMDWMQLCLEAKHHIMEQYPSAPEPITQHSRIGFHLLDLGTHQGDGQSAESVGYRCPIKPPLYVNLENSGTASIVYVNVA